MVLAQEPVQGGHRVHGRELHLVGDQRLQRRRAAAIGDVQHLGPRLGVQQLHRQVRGGAGAGGGVGDRARPRLGQRDQLRDVRRPHGGVDAEVLRVRRQQPEGGEAAVVVVGDGVQQEGRHRVGGVGAQQQGVAVRLRAGDGVVPDRAGGAGPVVHHHGPPEIGRDALRQHAGERVRGAAGGPGHHERDLALRPFGRTLGARGAGGREAEGGKARFAPGDHRCVLPVGGTATVGVKMRPRRGPRKRATARRRAARRPPRSPPGARPGR